MSTVLEAPSRARMRALDQCLDVLERAAERGETHVSDQLALHVSSVPGISAGVEVRRALELVFREQKRCLDPLRMEAGRDGIRGTAEACEASSLTRDEAAELTRRIKGNIRQLGHLLLEAHDKRAWSALQYPSWERYVRVEFGLGRSRSYQLLDQGRVIRAISEAVDGAELPPISPYAAAQIKPALAQVLGSIRDGIAGQPAAAIPGIVRNVVEATRSELVARPEPLPTRMTVVDPPDHAAQHLVEVIDYLSNRPPVAEFLDVIGPTYFDHGRLWRATAWLNALADAQAAVQPMAGLISA